MNNQLLVGIGTKGITMGPRFDEIGARGKIESRPYPVADAGLDFGNYCLKSRLLGFESSEVPSGPQVI